VAQEELEQGELGAGQIEGAAAAACGAAGEVELDVGVAQHLAVVGGGAAQQRAQPREQLLERERLHQVVVGARVQPGDAVAHLVARGEHQDRRLGACAAQPPAGLDAVDVGHQHVEHDRVRLPLVVHGDRGGAVLGGHHVVALRERARCSESRTAGSSSTTRIVLMPVV